MFTRLADPRDKWYCMWCGLVHDGRVFEDEWNVNARYREQTREEEDDETYD